MTWCSHVLIGMESLWLIYAATPSLFLRSISCSLVAAISLAALLPDLDSPLSKIGNFAIAAMRPFAPLAQTISSTLGPRTALDPWIGLVILALVATALGMYVNWPLGLAIWLGYASHLAADSCTVSGIQLLYPNHSPFQPLAKRLRFITGSWIQDALLPLFALPIFWLLATILSSFRS